MQLSNNLNLPLPLFEAVKADPYNNEGSDVTVTGLLKPVQMWVLEKRHKDKLIPDVADRLWATYGQLMALLLERVVKASPELAARFKVEQRCSTVVEGWKVSGAFDLYDLHANKISDWKFVGAFAAKMLKAGNKIEWERQVNILRWLYHEQHGQCADNLEIVCILRDYSEKVENEGLLPCEVVPMPVHGLVTTGLWIKAKVLEFQTALQVPDEALPPCGDEDRWIRKGGRAIRCERYCPVRSVCCQVNPALAMGKEK